MRPGTLLLIWFSSLWFFWSSFGTLFPILLCPATCQSLVFLLQELQVILPAFWGCGLEMSSHAVIQPYSARDLFAQSLFLFEIV